MSAAPLPVVIPDCCNIGVVFRSLLTVNAIVLAASLVRSAGLGQGLQAFVETSMIVELACLWSLLALCLLRRMLLRSGRIKSVSPWAQRMLCALAPAAVTAAVVRFLTPFAWLLDGFAYFTPQGGALAAALLGIALQHYFELRTRAYSPALMEARLQALQARIRPHFLFNSLNAVLSLIRTEPRRAETTLEDLADLFRVLMRDSRSMSTLEQEIRLCKQYLAIEQIRLGERLQVRWDMENIGEDVLRKAQVPVLLLQPLLENAVHHGVETAAAPAPIQVQMSRSIDRIQIVVTNPFKEGASAPDGNQMALSNIRERLELLYDVEAQLSTSAAHGCFEVRLRFPYSTSPA